MMNLIILDNNNNKYQRHIKISSIKLSSVLLLFSYLRRNITSGIIMPRVRPICCFCRNYYLYSSNNISKCRGHFS